MSRRLLCPLLALALTLAAAGAAPLTRNVRALERRLSRIIAGPDFQHGFWGVYVYDATRQQVLFDHNGERWFTPASNAKLFTLAAALQLLGPNYRFHTVVETTAAPDDAGVIHGNVILVGVGDPSLSGRPYPYRNDPPEPALPYDPMLVPRRLAQELAARGVKRIEGEVIGDDAYFADAPYPSGWAISDMEWDYGAPVSALTLNDNTRFLQIFPTAPGAAPRLVWTPALDPPQLEDEARTGTAGSLTRLRLRTDALSGGLRLSGSIARSSRGVLEALAVHHPAGYAAGLLRQALQERGIMVGGGARGCHQNCESGRVYQLAEWESPPLAEILQVTAKVSQNLEAELMLRLLGKLRGPPDALSQARAGEAVRAEFLQHAGLNARDTALVDGSGLARTDLVTPAGVVRLLRYMGRGPDAAVWKSLLPIAGVDGTLEHRFLHDPSARDRLRAKTGSLSHVNSLSGYVRARNGDQLVFSLLSNNVDRPSSQVRHQLDQMANVLAAW
ncbi:MAG: D-alanyl-D-alanine carboxypeptidase/D-alanyl-D-alanine endopeptidase [Terriglobales bacterium]